MGKICSSGRCKKKIRAYVARAHTSGCARVINFHIKVAVSIECALVGIKGGGVFSLFQFCNTNLIQQQCACGDDRRIETKDMRGTRRGRWREDEKAKGEGEMRKG